MATLFYFVKSFLKSLGSEFAWGFPLSEPHIIEELKGLSTTSTTNLRCFFKFLGK